MGAAATSGTHLHSSNALDFTRTQQLYCQRCGQNALLTSSVNAGRVAGHPGHTPSQLEVQDTLSANRGCQHAADTSRHCQHISGLVPCTQKQREQVPAQTPQVSASAASRQEPFAELASEVLAWQQDDSGMQGPAEQAAAQEACKVLRFDPALGTDGGFYFITPQSLGIQSPPAGQSEQDQVSADAISSHQQAANMPAHQQHSGSTDGLRSQLPAFESVQTAAQSGSEADGTQADGTTGKKAAQAVSDSSGGSAIMAEVGSAQVQLMQTTAAEDVGKQQAEVQAQPAFPVHGGGEAGVLLRAAAAAAAGCSHELVVAAAGQAHQEEEPGSEGRYKCRSPLSCQKCCPASVSNSYDSIRLLRSSCSTYCNPTRLLS